MKLLKSAMALPFAFSATFIALQQVHAASTAACNPNTVGTPAMFQCEDFTSAPAVVNGAPSAYNSAKQYFPQSWSQLGYNQRHDPVFAVPSNAPAYLTEGAFWAAPLTGLDFQDVKRALPSTGNNAESWGSATSQYLGNVVGVSVVQGIAFVQNGRREITAVDVATGAVIWHQEVSSSAGMGQAIVQKINGKLMVFVPVGDAAFTAENAIKFATSQPGSFRGANFAGVYAYDALSGKPVWQYATKGSARPTPVYKDGKLYVTTNAPEMSILDAATGAEVGSFTNPTPGYSGLAAANWLDVTYADGSQHTILVYGTIRPGRIFGVDVTDPTAPSLAWQLTPPYAQANAPGDTSMAVDPDLGIAYTTVYSDAGDGLGPYSNLIAIDVKTGAVKWMDNLGYGDTPPGYKGSIPMVKDGVVYTGNTLDGTYHAYNAATGEALWSTDLSQGDGLKHRPRAASVLHDGKLIVVESRFIHTLDPATGAYLNRFQNPGFFGVWGVNQPTIVGNMAILGSISGWVFATPVDFITTNAGIQDDPGVIPLGISPPKQAIYSNSSAKPKKADAGQFDSTVLAYAGGQSHNSVTASGPTGVSWSAPLKDATPLDAPARDESLYGAEIATQMMHNAFGAGTGVSPASGVLYVGSDRYTVDAINATTGELIWRAATQNANFGQPIVTSGTVVVSQGDPWLNLGKTGQLKKKSPGTSIGDNWASLRGYDRDTGEEKWTVYTSTNTSATTPLYRNGNLYWVDGGGKLWAVNADTGAPVAPIMDTTTGQPALPALPGFNAISSPNVYHAADGSDLMVVGMANPATPNRMLAINLDTGATAWTQDLSGTGEVTYITGFSSMSPAVSQSAGLVIGTVFTGADTAAGTTSVTAFALDAADGTVKWTSTLATGALPAGFAGITPVIDGDRAYFNDPVSGSVQALDLADGSLAWDSPVSTPAGKFSWGPGTLVDGKLIQPVGPDLVTLDAATGSVLNTYHVGGSFTYNNATVAGGTLYIGNSWGWALAIPVSEVTGG